jgi:hypothetical protein
LQKSPQGLKPGQSKALAARLKSCPDTCLAEETCSATLLAFSLQHNRFRTHVILTPVAPGLKPEFL